MLLNLQSVVLNDLDISTQARPTTLHKRIIFVADKIINSITYPKRVKWGKDPASSKTSNLSGSTQSNMMIAKECKSL